MSAIGHAHYYISQSDVSFLAWYTSTNADHETKLDEKAVCHVYSNSGSRSSALMTAREACNHDIVLADLAECIAVGVLRF